MTIDAIPDGSVITLVIKKEALIAHLGQHQRNQLWEAACFVATSMGQDDHLVTKDRHSEFDRQGHLEDAEMLAILVSNVIAASPESGEDEFDSQN